MLQAQLGQLLSARWQYPLLCPEHKIRNYAGSRKNPSAGETRLSEAAPFELIRRALAEIFLM